MTDFLSMLLARNTSLETGNDFLHPRLRSRFEQVPADEQMDKIDSNLDGEQLDPAGALLPSFTVQAPAINKQREPDLQNEAISRPGPLNAPSPVWRELLPAPNRIIATDPQPSRAGAQP